MDYRLDLNTLLLMLGKSTGYLSAEIQRIAGTKGRCQIVLRLEKGSIATCVIKDEHGKEIASGEAALNRIQRQVLEWHYDDQPSAGAARMSTIAQQSPIFEPLPRTAVPQRTIQPILQNQFASWPRLYRSVYSLVDGKTTVGTIVHLLAREQSAERILDVLIHLQAAGFIIFTDQASGGR